jgi:hypothetical protein
MTGLAETSGATSGSVTDIYLPTWFARQLPVVHLPLLVLIGWLHRRTLGRRRAGTAAGGNRAPRSQSPTTPGARA